MNQDTIKIRRPKVIGQKECKAKITDVGEAVVIYPELVAGMKW